MLFFNLLLPVFFVLWVVFPLMTAYIAYSHGRSFWRWYGVGFALPFVSLFVVMAVAARDQWTERNRAPKPQP